MAPQSQLLVVVEVGSRTCPARGAAGARGGGARRCPAVSDRWPQGLRPALLTHFGQRRHPARRQERGPMPTSRWRPLPALLYAPVVQSSRRWRSVGVPPRECVDPDGPSHSSGRHVAGRSIPRLSKAQPRYPAARGGERAPGSSCVRAKRACGISWGCSRCITIACCPRQPSPSARRADAHP